MAADGRLRRVELLSPFQALHESLLREVLKRVRGMDLVLRGGTALAFAYGVDRHSTDLDFDSHGKVELRGQIRRAARAAGVHLKWVKRDDTKDREQQVFRARYESPSKGGPANLKIDVHWKHPPKSRDIVIVQGIRTYRVETIFGQKVAAIADRAKATDLFDVAFVMKSYGDRLSDDQIRWADSYLSGWKRVRKRYAKAFETSEVLKDLTTVERILSRFQSAIDVQKRRRGLHHQHQRIPIPDSVIIRVLLYENNERFEEWKRANPRWRPGVTQRARTPTARSTRTRSTAERDEDLDWSPSH